MSMHSLQDSTGGKDRFVVVRLWPAKDLRWLDVMHGELNIVIDGIV